MIALVCLLAVFPRLVSLDIFPPLYVARACLAVNQAHLDYLEFHEDLAMSPRSLACLRARILQTQARRQAWNALSECYSWPGSERLISLWSLLGDGFWQGAMPDPVP